MYVCLFLIRKGIGVKEKGPLIYMESMWSCSFLSFSKGSYGMFEFTDVDICLCKSVWPSAEDWISTSCCRLFQQMCLTPEKAKFPLLSFLCALSSPRFSEFQKSDGQQQNRIKQPYLYFSSVFLSFWVQ